MSNNGLSAVSLALATLTVAVGCSSSAPQSFTVSNDAVAKLVHDVIAGDSEAAPLDGSPQVNCTGETTCTIAYTVKETGGTPFLSGSPASDIQLIEPTRQIWNALFTEPKFQTGTITVSGPVTTVGGQSETGTYFTLSCNRYTASQIDWNSVDGKSLRTLFCNYTAQTQRPSGYAGPTFLKPAPD